MRTPLVAKSLSKALSKAAKKRGLPENLVKAMEAKRQSEAETTTVPVSIGPEAETVKKTRKRTLKKKNTA
jgi:Rod binding domain-containing protein